MSVSGDTSLAMLVCGGIQAVGGLVLIIATVTSMCRTGNSYSVSLENKKERIAVKMVNYVTDSSL